MFGGGQTANFSSYEESNRQFGGHIIYSSGTTGTYKKLLVDGAFEDQRNEARARAYSFSRQTIYHTLNFGMWTTVGFKNPSAVWHEGGCVVFDPRGDKFNHFFRHPITSTVLTPEHLKDFIQAADKSRPSNHEFELVVTAGFLPLALAEAAARLLTKRITIFYGSSELGSPLMRSDYQAKDDLYWFTPVGARTIQIVDENDNECAINQEGELRILTADIDCKSYLDDDEANSRIFRGDFFYPGDMAIRRSDGRIRILGRTADVLNLEGKKIAAAPLEHAIQRALGVAEVCLFSRLDDDGNEELMVAIQSDHEIPRSQLEAIVPKLPKFQRVRFSIRKQFPRTETGMRKTRRTVLRNDVFSGKYQTT
jgi:acyl-coenzyme A synthetase/AMP-(fatty) acid ligase